MKYKKKVTYWEDKKSKIFRLTAEEYLELNAEFLKEQGYKLIEIRQHLWWVLMSVTKDNKNYLYVAPNISNSMDFDNFAEGLDYLKQENKKGYIRCYLICQDKTNNVYVRLLKKCCTLLYMPIRNEASLIKLINRKILHIPTYNKKKYKQKVKEKINQNGNYEKVFPHVMTDDEDSDFEKAIDDMIFMDIMFDD